MADDWETVDVPAGKFIGWGNKAGQFVEGEVYSYSASDGKDFNGMPCPRIDVMLSKPAASFNKKNERTDVDAGELVSLTAGQANLKRALIHANLSSGDQVRIELSGFTEVDKGTVKMFDVKVRRATTETKSEALSDDEVPF